jgi:hypothetical protein
MRNPPPRRAAPAAGGIVDNAFFFNGRFSIMGELKLVTLLSVMVFILLGPTAVYLMSFQGEGLAGDIMSDIGRFILLPPTLFHRALGSSGVSIALGLIGQFLWFMAWVGGARWLYLRKRKAATPAA